MQSTPIKINKSPADRKEAPKNILNLNGSSASASTGQSRPVDPRPSRQTKKYLWIFIVLTLIEGALIAWLYSVKPISPYFKIFPQNLIASSYFNQSSLLNLLENTENDRIGWPIISWGDTALREILDKARIEQPEQLLGLFEDQMALAILPQKTGQNPVWIAIATLKISSDVFLQAQDKVEQTLKQNYSLTGESYRQIKITQIKTLDQNQNSLFYAQTKSYFILSNDAQTIKITLDKIIGR